MKNGCTCDVCKNDIHRASFAKHLRSDEHSMKAQIFPSNFFIETNKIKQKNYNPKSGKQILRDNFYG